MINLLPPETKKSYRYAEWNVGLLRWVTAGLIGLIGVGIIATYGWLSVHQALVNTDKQATALQASLKQAKLVETNKKVTEISNSFKLVEKVLSQEILFSKLLKQMATALPTGTNLTGLNISDISGGGGLDVTVEAVNVAAATQVQVNLSDPTNQIFAKADIQNISCDTSAAADPAYPCKITLRTQFADNNPFLFINQKQAKL